MDARDACPPVSAMTGSRLAPNWHDPSVYPSRARHDGAVSGKNLAYIEHLYYYCEGYRDWCRGVASGRRQVQ